MSSFSKIYICILHMWCFTYQYYSLIINLYAKQGRSQGRGGGEAKGNGATPPPFFLRMLL